MGLKIRKVKFLDEVQFGDLELDFLNSQTGLPYTNIVLLVITVLEKQIF